MTNPSTRLTTAWAATLLVAACGDGREPHTSAAAAVRPGAPPAGLLAHQVPQFVCFGSDDNGDPDGMAFLTELFAGRHNPPGRGNAATFDGTPARYSFYVNTHYLAPDGGNGDDVASRALRNAWRRALDDGHEIGVHTHSHPHGRELTLAQWDDEMTRCIELLERPDEAAPGPGLGVPAAALVGFRAPYLETTDRTLAAAWHRGFRYDCSLEERPLPGEDEARFRWPYRLDAGSPGNPEIGHHPGMWEIPVYSFIVPPDEACARLGVAPGLRRALARRHARFDAEAGTITGMDWNLWCQYSMTPAEFLATVTYGLELRLAGDRAPLTLGLHSELYAERTAFPTCPNASSDAAGRRAALATFLGRVLSHDDVRVVTTRDLVSWLEHPRPLAP